MERQDGQTWREWLEQTLPPYLTRDPKAVAAIQLTPPAGSPGLVMIRDHTLVIPETGLFDLTQYTLTTLVQAVQAQGWGATLLDGIPGSLAATALMDTGWSQASPVPLQNVTVYPYLTIAGSTLWQVLQPVAAQWDAQWADIVDLVLGTVQGPWLDALGTYLGVPRIGGEPDSLYQTRLYGLAITTSPNNVSMAQFFAALGYSVAVTDTTPGQLTATVQWPLHPPQGFVYSQADVAGMVDTLKAAGVLATIVFASNLSDRLSLSDSVTQSTLDVTGILWGGTLPDGTGAAQGFPWNRTVWR